MNGYANLLAHSLMASSISRSLSKRTPRNFEHTGVRLDRTCALSFDGSKTTRFAASQRVQNVGGARALEGRGVHGSLQLLECVKVVSKQYLLKLLARIPMQAPEKNKFQMTGPNCTLVDHIAH
eukprot:8637358-Pyramimonas_sp.AAC.1